MRRVSMLAKPLATAAAAKVSAPASITSGRSGAESSDQQHPANACQPNLQVPVLGMRGQLPSQTFARLVSNIRQLHSQLCLLCRRECGTGHCRSSGPGARTDNYAMAAPVRHDRV